MESGKDRLELTYTVEGKEVKVWMNKTEFEQLKQWEEDRYKEMSKYFYNKDGE